MPNLGGWELVILIGVLVLLFGAKRLPDMARSIGQSARVFKGEMKGMKDDGTKGEAPAEQPAAADPKALPEGQAKPADKAPETSRAAQPGSGSTSAQ
ncbi:Sec-independent protein translocase subunit TatA [Pseudonocardia adelaidensis]|uniref:Sec-independent protein translocase protein TatA n=1 Tax=Pseudonocardia adelaidensis TaxID=648754 RepID=A0ABP9NF27_9PSEU